MASASTGLTTPPRRAFSLDSSLSSRNRLAAASISCKVSSSAATAAGIIDRAVTTTR